MTTLACKDLITSLDHEVRFTHDGRLHIAAIIPYLLKFGNPAGAFTLKLISGSEVLFSQSFTASDISDQPYSHTYHPIIPNNPIQIEKGLYTIRLESSGYSFSNSDYIAWIQQHEDIQNQMEYTPENDFENPLTVRIKIYKTGISL